MIKKIHLSRVLSTFTGGLMTVFWRRVFAALLLALTLLSTGQTPLAQAAPDDPADVKFEIAAFPKAPKPLCINEPLKIYVSVNKLIHKTINSTDYDLPRGFVTGVKVSGSVSNDKGKLTPPNITIGAEDGLSELGPGEADFLFTAKKPGKATITFNADVPGIWSGSVGAILLGQTIPAKKAEIQVTVRNCKFKVKTISRWNSVVYKTVAMTDAEVTVDAQGQLKSSAIVDWATPLNPVPIPGCGGIKVAIDPSAGVWSGKMDDNGQLKATLTFEPSKTSLTATCFGVTKTVEAPLTHDPLTISVPNSGGVITRVAMATGLSGTAVIIITPEDGESTAFNPGTPAVLEGSIYPSGLIGWNGFPGLFSTMLATN